MSNNISHHTAPEVREAASQTQSASPVTNPSNQPEAPNAAAPRAPEGPVARPGASLNSNIHLGENVSQNENPSADMLRAMQQARDALSENRQSSNASQGTPQSQITQRRSGVVSR